MISPTHHIQHMQIFKVNKDEDSNTVFIKSVIHKHSPKMVKGHTHKHNQTKIEFRANREMLNNRQTIKTRTKTRENQDAGIRNPIQTYARLKDGIYYTNKTDFKTHHTNFVIFAEKKKAVYHTLNNWESQTTRLSRCSNHNKLMQKQTPCFDVTN